MSSFFFKDTAPTEIYTLSLHDALPICRDRGRGERPHREGVRVDLAGRLGLRRRDQRRHPVPVLLPGADLEVRRLEEHTSELQSRQYLVCRLLLEKQKIRIH